MITLQESGNSQTFSFIPRSYSNSNTYTIDIVSESQNKSIYSATTSTFTLVDYYYQYSAIFSNLKQDNFYMLTISHGTSVVFKDKIFCTNQSVQDYTVNNNEYTEVTSTNEFVFYEN